MFATESQLVRVALARGDLPESLARLDAIDADDASTGTAAEHELLRAQALAAAHLWSEALHALKPAQVIWERSAQDDHEGRFEVIRLTLLAGDPVGAQALGLRAQRSFAAQQRDVYAARAHGFVLAAAIAAGRVRRSALRSGRRAAAILAAAGWRRTRCACNWRSPAPRSSSARSARHGDELAACASLRRRGPVADRIEARHVEALIQVAVGNAAGAQRTARRA